MSLFSIIAALLLERWQPDAKGRLSYEWVQRYADFFRLRFNTGEHHHGRLAWLAACSLPVFLIGLTFHLLDALHPLLALIFTIAVAFLALNFRAFLDRFAAIHQALRDHDRETAATLLSLWRGVPSQELDEIELARVAIETALLAACREAFAVIVWLILGMLLGLGPAGMVIYRLTQYLDRHWGALSDLDHGDFGVFSRQALHWMEWLPLRLNAMTYAIVGNFEDAVFCWRTQAKIWPQPEAGILLASGAGAMGVRLGHPIPENGGLTERPELGMGDEADPDYMQSTTGLIWRGLVFWLVLLLLLNLATLVS
jgi:cobalamin biosynthesis protein CobD/CbiB